MCRDVVSDGDDCGTLTYWIDWEPSDGSTVQLCGYAGYVANDVSYLLDNDVCSNSKRVVCDIRNPPTGMFVVEGAQKSFL